MLQSQNSQGSSLKPSRFCFFTCWLLKQYRMNSPISFKTQKLNIWFFSFIQEVKKESEEPQHSALNYSSSTHTNPGSRIPEDPSHSSGMPLEPGRFLRRKSIIPTGFFHIHAQMKKMEHISPNSWSHFPPERGSSKRWIFKPPCPHVLRTLLSPCTLKAQKVVFLPCSHVTGS